MTGSGINSGGGGIANGGGNATGAGGHMVSGNATINIVQQAATAVAPANAPSAPLIAAAGDVFVSYARNDRARVEPLLACLRQLAITYWIDDYLTPGEPFDRRIDLQVSICRAHVIAWSSLAVASDWVRSEAEKGRQRGTLIPILLERCDIPMPFGQIHATDLSRWSGQQSDPAWRGIVDALARKLARPGLPELAALVQLRDGPGVRQWATRYPDDPFVAKKLR